MTESHTHGGTDAPECTTCKCLNIDPKTVHKNGDKLGHIDHENSVRTPVLFRGRIDDPSTLSEVIGQGIGAGSVCWENIAGAGEFDSSRASRIVDEMMAWIHIHYMPKPLVTDDYGLVVSDGEFPLYKDSRPTDG